MSTAFDSRIAPLRDPDRVRDEGGLTPEDRRRLREYGAAVARTFPPMTPQQVETVVALLRPTSRRLCHPDEPTR